MGRRNKGRDIDGLVLLDKPLGCSSNAALQRVRRAFDARKAGHTGSLDPLATGLLPICLGEATKLSSYLLSADKRYRVTAQTGCETTTGDREGEPTRHSDVPVPSVAELNRLLGRFIGDQTQIPPMYSALKKDGRRLYEHARAGRQIEREPRPVTVAALGLVDCSHDQFTLDASVSGGTYIRTLVEDIARAFGGCAHVASLRRSGVGDLGARLPMVALADVEAANGLGDTAFADWLWPVSTLLQDWPSVTLNEAEAQAMNHGQGVAAPPDAPSDGCLLGLRGTDGLWLGIGYVDDDGELRSRRLFTRPQA